MQKTMLYSLVSGERVWYDCRHRLPTIIEIHQVSHELCIRAFVQAQLYNPFIPSSPTPLKRNKISTLRDQYIGYRLMSRTAGVSAPAVANDGRKAPPGGRDSGCARETLLCPLLLDRLLFSPSRCVGTQGFLNMDLKEQRCAHSAVHLDVKFLVSMKINDLHGSHLIPAASTLGQGFKGMFLAKKSRSLKSRRDGHHKSNSTSLGPEQIVFRRLRHVTG
ncbi:hypothetical protein RRG08_029949 [Elysia crispata]|uniref:Uncharacterized protein n=1 Tax=Elysia crispata TaxID=231223 RepID=A0AAE1DGY2_9GAST|nr:hypothetical protein RRG08_029949 [Elysia crispata]